MKKLFVLLFALSGGLLFGQNTPGTLNFSVKTINNERAYAPKHVLAIWIEDSNGSFVKTLKLRADKRKQYLLTWNLNTSGNTVDAVTGGTLSSHGTHDLSWDCTNTSGEVIADGDYKLWIEYTSEHAQGPLTSISFTKGTDGASFTPPDENYFVDMDLVFTPEGPSGLENPLFGIHFLTYPNPSDDQVNIEMQTLDGSDLSLKVYNLEMKLVSVLWNGPLRPGKHTFVLSKEGNKLTPGTYFVVVAGTNTLSSRRIIFK